MHSSLYFFSILHHPLFSLFQHDSKSSVSQHAHFAEGIVLLKVWAVLD